MSTTQSDNVQPTPTPRITKVEKEKNPKRVAAGKRLAAYSKAARERIAHQQTLETIKEDPQEPDCFDETPDQTQDSTTGGYNTMTILTGVGVLTGLACLYYTYKQDKRSDQSERSEKQRNDRQTQEPQFEHDTPERPPTTPVSRLRSFD